VGSVCAIINVYYFLKKRFTEQRNTSRIFIAWDKKTGDTSSI